MSPDILLIFLRLGYLETDYFGGIGEQAACVADENGILLKKYERSGAGEINEALGYFNVQAQGGNDAFDTVGLSRIRSNDRICRAYVSGSKLMRIEWPVIRLLFIALKKEDKNSCSLALLSKVNHYYLIYLFSISICSFFRT